MWNPNVTENQNSCPSDYLFAIQEEVNKQQDFMEYVNDNYTRFHGFAKNYLLKKVKKSKVIRYIHNDLVDNAASDILHDCIITISNRLSKEASVQVNEISFFKKSIKIDWQYNSGELIKTIKSRFDFGVHPVTLQKIKICQTLIKKTDTGFKYIISINRDGTVIYKSKHGKNRMPIDMKISNSICNDLVKYLTQGFCLNPPLFEVNLVESIIGSTFHGTNYGGYLNTSLQFAAGKWRRSEEKKNLVETRLDHSNSYHLGGSYDFYDPMESNKTDVDSELFMLALEFASENYTPFQAGLFKLRHINQMKYSEIARETGVSSATVASKIKDIEQKLSQIINYNQLKEQIDWEKYHGCNC